MLLSWTLILFTLRCQEPCREVEIHSWLYSQNIHQLSPNAVLNWVRTLRKIKSWGRMCSEVRMFQFGFCGCDKISWWKATWRKMCPLMNIPGYSPVEQGIKARTKCTTVTVKRMKGVNVWPWFTSISSLLPLVLFRTSSLGNGATHNGLGPSTLVTVSHRHAHRLNWPRQFLIKVTSTEITQVSEQKTHVTDFLSSLFLLFRLHLQAPNAKDIKRNELINYFTPRSQVYDPSKNMCVCEHREELTPPLCLKLQRLWGLWQESAVAHEPFTFWQWILALMTTPHVNSCMYSKTTHFMPLIRTGATTMPK